MLSAVDWALGAAALVIGITGAWSPCGFSMVETVGLSGLEGRRRTTLAACATFAPGAVLGGVVTFGLLAVAGAAVHGAGGRAAYLAAAAIAVIAAVLEARGTRIAPQIRRQLPERWRWVMPLPVAAGLYGVLLGLGFTTFVLSFGVWALAGIAFALGKAGAGLAIGVAFGIGRALPVVALAPIVDRPLGVRCTELMAGRLSLYRGFRLGDAFGLLLVGAALAVGAGGTASAAHHVVKPGFDPSVGASALAFQRPDGTGILKRHGDRTVLPGTDPAIGGPYVAVLGPNRVKLLDRTTLDVVRTISAKGANAVAVARGWLVYRASGNARDALRVRRLRRHGRPGEPHLLISVPRPSQLGRPSLDGGTLVYAVAHRTKNSIRLRRLNGGAHGTIVSARTSELTNASVQGDHVLYVRIRRLRQSPQATSPAPFVQELVLSKLGGGEAHVIYSRGGDGRLWSTALSSTRAYFTLVSGGTQILFVSR